MLKKLILTAAAGTALVASSAFADNGWHHGWEHRHHWHPYGGYVVVASKGGDDHPPGWLLNLEAEPNVEVQVGRTRRPASARVLGRDDPDFERLWRLVNSNNSDRYDGYQSKTARQIPLVVLTPS